MARFYPDRTPVIMLAMVVLAACLMPALAVAASDTPAAPGIAPAPTPNDAIPDGTIGKAGAALHDVAKLQQRYQGRIESATPEQKQSLSAQADAEAVQVIQSHGLSLLEYANVIRIAQNNPVVRRRLLDEASKGQ